MGRLEGRVALIVGAGTGIGKATAKRFAAEGAKVVVTMRTAENGRKVVEEIRAAGGEASYVAGDAGIKDDVLTMVRETERLYGALDIVIHNAAYLAPGAVDEIEDTDLDKAIAVNLKACYWLTRAALPSLKKASHGGRIIMTTTPARRTAVSKLSVYIATKMAINGFVRSVAIELAPHKITVNEIGPGITVTEMSGDHLSSDTLEKARRLVPLGRLGSPEDVAKGMLFLASDDGSYITGHTLVIDGGGTLPHITEGILQVER
ncbi:MAG TPA: SDR family oxidoreductase [Alphaproteobacteria bacterium]|nr:SDR family oxidoreductase [Alphaproteobacteria bacterium]